jgi:hypothetical protein
MIASDFAGWTALSISQESGRPISDTAKQLWKNRYAERDIAAAKAYQEALSRQGGIRKVE